MKRGRKPKPTARKRLEGNSGRRKLNEAEPRVPLEMIFPTYDLGEEGRKRFDKLRELGEAWLTAAEAGGLTDLANVEGWLVQWGPYLEKQPPMIQESRGHGGVVRKINPALVSYRLKMNLARLMRSSLGFDPAARSEYFSPRDEDADELAEQEAAEPIGRPRLRGIKGGKA
jgi:phage terminase small subunit